MTHKMKELLEQRMTESFVGRMEEMTALLQTLEQDRPVVVHVHGIGGIGKSNLLEAFAERARKRDAAVVCLDCRTIEPTERGFLDKLSEAIGEDTDALDEAAERLALLGERVVLALDTYEVFRLMDTWLRQVFAPALRDNVRVFLFGREAPVSAWLVSPGWQELFQSIRLESLKEEEAVELLLKLSVKEEMARNINRFAHGHPLALKLAASALKERPSLKLNEVVAQYVVEELTRLYLSDVRDPITREALDAASVVRRTTHSLLSAMLPHAESQDAYDRLHALPFVESGSDGLIVHDAVREAIASALRAADPNRYRSLRRAAWSQLRTELGAAGKSELWRYTADTLYFLENPFIREGFFPSDMQPFAVEPAQPDDSPVILTIAERHDGLQAAALFENWLTCIPSAYYALRDQDNAVAGFYCVLDPVTVKQPTLKHDPIIWNWWQHLQDDPLPKNQRALFLRRWLDADEGEGPSAVQAACWLDIKRTYLEHRSHLRRVYATVQNPLPFWPALQKLGFQALDNIQVEIDGKQYHSAMLDFGPSLVSGWLSGLVDAELGIESNKIMDVEARELIVDGQRVGLTKLEFEVMNYLYQHEGKVVTRISLLEDVWGYEYNGGSNVVDAVISSLRKKLGEQATLIETVTGAGYRFRRAVPTAKE